MKYCVNCGKKLEENSGFCTECGSKVGVENVVNKPKKEVSGCSIASMVLGICVHAFQAFYYFVVLFILDSIKFLGTIFSGKRVNLSLFERIQATAYLLRYSFPILIVLAIVGIVLGYIGSQKGNKKMATAGIILGISQLIIIGFELVFVYALR